jgi:ribosomal protein S19E (S16A)
MRKYGLSYEATVNRLANAGVVNQTNRNRLCEEAQGQIDSLATELGVEEEWVRPKDIDYSQAVQAKALKLYSEAAVSIEMLADVLGVEPDKAEERVRREGYERPEDPLYDEAAVLDLLS